MAIFFTAALAEMSGRRSLMFLSMLFASLFNIAAATLHHWPAFLMLRFLEGIALGGVPAVAMAYLSEEIHPSSLGRVMGLYIAGTAFGGMMGRVGCGLLVDLSSWRIAMAAFGALDLLCALGFRLLLPPSRNFKRQMGFHIPYHLEAWRSHLRHEALPLVFLTGFLVMGSFVAIYNYAGFRLEAAPYHMTQSEISLIFTSYILGMISSSLAGRLLDRYPRHFVLNAGLIFMVAGIGLTLLPQLVSILVGIASLTIGFFVAHAVASGSVGKLAQSTKGHASSLYLLAYYLGSSFIGSMAGWFWASHGWVGVVSFTLLLLVVAFGLTRRLGLYTQQADPAEP